MEDAQFVTDCLKDYLYMLEVGLSLKHPLMADRTRIIATLKTTIQTRTGEEESTNGELRTNTRGDDNFAGGATSERDDGAGPRPVDRGHSSAGPTTANRGDETRGWALPAQVGSPSDLGTPNDGENDDRSESNE